MELTKKGKAPEKKEKSQDRKRKVTVARLKATVEENVHNKPNKPIVKGQQKAQTLKQRCGQRPKKGLKETRGDGHVLPGEGS